MGSYIIRKIIGIIPLLLIVSIIMFLFMNLLPGNVVDSILSEGGTVEQQQKLMERYGLDLPIYVQYWTWLTNFVRGDMGVSHFSGQEVSERLAERFPVTLELILISIIIAILVGVTVGLICAVKRNKPTDYVLSTISMVGVAMPAFWLGMLLIMLLSVKLQWLPASGFVKFSVDPIENLKTMILPSVTLGLSLAAPIARQTRSAMLDALSQDYIITAYSKGLKNKLVFWKHALRNALIPVVTSITNQINGLIGGAFVVETVFLIPGMGKSMVDAINQRDNPVVMGLSMAVVITVVIVNLVADILNAYIDPRITFSEK